MQLQIHQQHWPPVDEDADEDDQAEHGEGGDDRQRNHGLPLSFSNRADSRLVAAVAGVWGERTEEDNIKDAAEKEVTCCILVSFLYDLTD